MKTISTVKAIVFGWYLLSSMAAMAQAGDEEADVRSNGKARDQAAINEALNGWWKKSMENHEQRIGWWRNAKFGMFVHWGVYSLPGGEWKGQKVSGYAEHLMRKEKISRADYLELAHKFNPVKFNADEWILAAKNAGMRYFIITSKHHDGFTLFDSKVSDFTLKKQSPFGRDPLKELADACRKHGVKFGFYYSHAFDWEHPDAPGNDWEYSNPGGDRNLFGGPDGDRNWFNWHPEELPQAVRYVDNKAIPQIRELLSLYHPDILWFDTPSKLPLSENIRILKAIREVDNKVVVNGRLARSAEVSFGDYKNTADRPAEFFPVTGDWEAIPTTNESYGYHKYDMSHKPVGHFIRLMANAAGRGGNLLMNIGPMGDGRIDTKDLDILNGIGAWMKINSESIYSTKATPLALQSWGTSTLKGNKLYLHVMQWPDDQRLVVGGLKSNINKAYLLADPTKKALKVTRLNNLDVAIAVGKIAIDTTNTVIVLETNGAIVADTVRLLTGTNVAQRLLAFDAAQQGLGLRYGDGKIDRFYVDGWSKKDQSLSWQVRVNEPMTFKATMKYIAVADGGGQLQVTLNDKVLFDKVNISDRQNGPAAKELGLITLPPGTHTLRMAPSAIEGTEIMKLLEVVLTPVTAGR